MLRAIQTDTLFPFGNTNLSGYQTCDTIANQCAGYRHYNGNTDTCQLCQEQMNVPEEQTVALTDVIDRHLAEQTGTDTAPDSADTMAAKCVQCIVIAELFLDRKSVV